MLQKDNGSYKKEINAFFDSIGVSAESFPTSSALCQARANLSHNAFIELNRNAVNIFYQEGGYKTWKGHRVLGIDGSTLQLPQHKTIREEFGEHGFGPKADSPMSLARISYLYDVFNGLVIDSQMKSFSTSEADLAWEHLNHVQEGDVVLFDRYYPSLTLMTMLKAMGVNFCFRMKNDWWKKVSRFTKSNKNDQLVYFNLPEKYHEWAKEYGVPVTIKCRLLKKKNKNGETEVLCTSLLSKNKYKKSAVCNLYKERWSVEEGYKLIKSRLEVENFSGKKSLIVMQDFYSRTVLLTLNAILCQKIKPSRKTVKKRVININKTLGLATTKRLFVKYLQNWSIHELVNYFTQVMTGQFNYSRKGQGSPRKKSNKKFSINYKTA